MADSSDTTTHIHPTGEGSPVSEVRVTDVSGLTEEQIIKKLGETPVPDGCVRLYRGITSEYSPKIGSNCFSPDLNISLDYSGNGKDARLVFIDVSTETLNDLRAYEKLSAAIGASYNVLGKLTGSVIDIPLGWTNGEKPNTAILRDMNGLGKKLSAINEYVAETMLNIYTEKRNLETKIATEYYQEHGRDAIPDWDQMFRDNPEHQKTMAKLNELWNYEQKELKQIAQQLPTLRDAPKITNKSKEDLKSGKHSGKIGIIMSGIVAAGASLFSSDAEGNIGELNSAKDAAVDAMADATPIVSSVKAFQDGKSYEEVFTRITDCIGVGGVISVGDMSRYFSRCWSLVIGEKATVDAGSIELASQGIYDFAKEMTRYGVGFTNEMQDKLKQQIAEAFAKDGKPVDPESQKVLEQIFANAEQKLNMETARTQAKYAVKNPQNLECSEYRTKDCIAPNTLSIKAPPQKSAAAGV